jgi:hypothetical protein
MEIFNWEDIAAIVLDPRVSPLTASNLQLDLERYLSDRPPDIVSAMTGGASLPQLRNAGSA